MKASLVAASLMVFAATSVVDAQQVTNSSLSGTLMSASKSIPSGATIPLMRTPSTGHFILTQASCNYANMEAGPFGPIPCETFNLGLALPQDQSIRCRNDSPNTGSCTISGIYQPNN